MVIKLHKRFCSVITVFIIFSMLFSMPGLADMVMVFEVNGKAFVSEDRKAEWNRPLKKGFIENNRFVKTFDNGSVVFVETKGSMKKMDSNQEVFIEKGQVKSIKGDIKAEKSSIFSSITSYISSCFSKKEEQVHAVANTGENTTSKSETGFPDFESEAKAGFTGSRSDKEVNEINLSDVSAGSASCAMEADSIEDKFVQEPEVSEKSFLFSIFSRGKAPLESLSVARKKRAPSDFSSRTSSSPQKMEKVRKHHFPAACLDQSKLKINSQINLLSNEITFKFEPNAVLLIMDETTDETLVKYIAPDEAGKNEKIIKNSGLAFGKTYNVSLAYSAVAGDAVTFKIKTVSRDELDEFMNKLEEALEKYKGASASSIEAFKAVFMQKKGYFANAHAQYLRAADLDEDKPSFFNRLADMCEMQLYK